MLAIPHIMINRYQNYSMPKDLADAVKKFISSHKDMGYTSVSEFCKDATRRFLMELEKGEKK